MEIRKHMFFAMAAVVLMVFELNGISFAAASGSGGASGAGETVLSTIESVITGSIGTIIGLCVTLLGLWTWIIKQDTAAGITMILGGVAITVAPGIFNGAKDMVTGVVSNLGSTSQAKY